MLLNTFERTGRGCFFERGGRGLIGDNKVEGFQVDQRPFTGNRKPRAVQVSLVPNEVERSGALARKGPGRGALAERLAQPPRHIRKQDLPGRPGSGDKKPARILQARA